MRCRSILYAMRDEASRDYGPRAAARFARINGIPQRGGACPCKACRERREFDRALDAALEFSDEALSALDGGLPPG